MKGGTATGAPFASAVAPGPDTVGQLLDWVERTSGTAALFGDSDAGDADGILRDRLGLAPSASRALPGVDGVREWARGPAGLEPGLILCTSGTGGRPKLVLRSLDALTAEGRSVAERLRLTPRSAVLCCVPVSHAFGLGMGPLACRASGARLIAAYPRSPRALRRVGGEHSLTHVIASPGQLEGWGAGTGRTPGEPLPGRPLLITAGAPLSRSTAEGVRAAFGAYPAQQYGCSEAGAVSIDLSGEFVEGRLGEPYPGVVVETVASGSAGSDALPGADHTAAGRLTIRSKALATRYVDDEPLTAESGLATGRLRTGDAGLLDDTGRLWLRGRLDRLLNVDGRKVDPAALENRIRQWPSVRDAAVVGAEDGGTVTRIVCFYVPDGSPHDGGVAAAETALRARGRTLSEHQRPTRYLQVEALPRTAIGKIDYPLLSDRAAAPRSAAPPESGVR